MNSIYGLLGEKLGHSFSPKIHSLIFDELKLDNYYHLFEVDNDNLQTAFLGLKALGIKGVNVTIPYKIDVMKFLDEVSSEAKNIGAVNTICFKDKISIGYNTDYYGFGMALEKYNVDLINKSAVILGTGGVAKSVMHYLIDNNISDLTLVSRDSSKIKDDFKDFKILSYNELSSMKDKDIVINCTPCGMYPKINNSPISKQDILKFQTAIDLIYNPKETKFLSYAKEHNIKTVNGLYMLVGQAVKSEEIWNCMNVNSEIIDRIYSKVSNMFEGD